MVCLGLRLCPTHSRLLHGSLAIELRLIRGDLHAGRQALPHLGVLRVARAFFLPLDGFHPLAVLTFSASWDTQRHLFLAVPVSSRLQYTATSFVRSAKLLALGWSDMAQMDPLKGAVDLRSLKPGLEIG